MADWRFRHRLADGRWAALAFTSRADGDLRVGGPAPELAARRAALAPGPWTWLHQEHGAAVVTVTRPGEHAGATADAAATAATGAVLSVGVADCAPVALVGERALAVVHVGWRGVVAGVLPAALDALDRLDAGAVRAVLGPCISPAAYEFGPDLLEEVAAVAGPAARGRTADGRPALDLLVSVRAVLGRAGVPVAAAVERCTAASPALLWSHRARGDVGRQALVAWIAEERPAGADELEPGP